MPLNVKNLENTATRSPKVTLGATIVGAMGLTSSLVYRAKFRKSKSNFEGLLGEVETLLKQMKLSRQF